MRRVFEGVPRAGTPEYDKWMAQRETARPRTGQQQPK